jgi:hypothetical protein
MSGLLLLSGCATAPQMPERFLGWWDPSYGTEPGIGMEIRPDGIIENRLQGSAEIIDREHYKVILIKDKEVYAIVRKDSINPPFYYWSYVRLEYTWPWKLHEGIYSDYEKLSYLEDNCEFSDSGFEGLPLRTHLKRIEDCGLPQTRTPYSRLHH